MRRWLLGPVGVAAGLALAPALTACGYDDDADDADKELAEFIALVEDQDCAGDVNRLYRIDDDLVLAHREDGNCADASYGVTLYGTTPDDVVCTASDSIAGPRLECTDDEAMPLFDTIAENLDASDLGLGDDHTVELVFDAHD